MSSAFLRSHLRVRTSPGLTHWPIYNPKDEFLNINDDTILLERFNSAGIELIAGFQEELRRAQ